LGAGRFHSHQTVAQHRRQYLDHLTVAVVGALQLAPQPLQAGRQRPVLEWRTVSERARLSSEEGEFPFPVHPHMLRHACGYKLANDGQDTRAVQHYLGHKNIQHTVRYTELSPERFKSFWED